MGKDQKAIYKEGGDKAHNVPPVSKKIDREISKPNFSNLVNRIAAAHKFILPVVMMVVLAWNFLGQAFLKEEYRFATYIGERMGDIENKSISTSQEQEAERAGIVATEQAKVEVEKNCINTRNDNALRAYYDCLAMDGTEYLCNFRRSEILKQLCDPFVAQQLDKTSPTPQPKGE